MNFLKCKLYFHKVPLKEKKNKSGDKICRFQRLGTKRERDGRTEFDTQGDFRNLQCKELRHRMKGQGPGSRSWSSQPTAQDGRVGFVAKNSSPPMVAKAVNDLILLNQQVWILDYPYPEGIRT